MAKKAKKATTKRWSKKVTETSDAMTLDEGVFKKTPRAIALSVRRSAERSTRRKSTPFRSAMSMLTFYENRAGEKLSATRKSKIEKAKEELRALYDRWCFCGRYRALEQSARMNLTHRMGPTSSREAGNMLRCPTRVRFVAKPTVLNGSDCKASCRQRPLRWKSRARRPRRWSRSEVVTVWQFHTAR
jgi:hypothetical protein